MQKRTASIKLVTTAQESALLSAVQRESARVCNTIVLLAQKNNCWNHVKLHRLAYYPIRATTTLGSQMVCNALKAVCNAFKSLKSKKTTEIPRSIFKPTSSVHYDKRTYSFKDGALSLYTLSGRIVLPMALGEPQKKYLRLGNPKEAQLVYRNKKWFFNLVFDIPDVPRSTPSGKVLGVDLGENVLAATSSGKLYGGKQLRHKRDCAVAQRRRLQRKGTKSSKRKLKKTSDKEARHIKHTNHSISKAIVQEAVESECFIIALENLTNIRDRIKATKRVRYRLHGWAWAQLQRFIVYKAHASGLTVVFVNPAYTSKTCAECKELGIRVKHRFVCKVCGIQRHSDLNASLNISRIAASADAATGAVNHPHMEAALA